MRLHMKKTYTFFFILIFISSCSIVSQNELESNIATPSHPSSATATAKPITPVTLQPTLTQQERENYIKLMLQNNNDCNLPCWWGIEPSRTSWADVEAMLLRIGVKKGQSEFNFGYGTGWLKLDSIQSYGSVNFSVTESIVETITVSASGNDASEFQKAWEYYSPDKILLEYGQPSRIMIDISTYGISDYITYGYWLYYDNLGFLVVTNGQTKRESTLRICPNFDYSENISGVQIYLKSYKNNQSLDSLVGKEKIEILNLFLKSFEEATSKTLEEYYTNFLLDNTSICFETPIELWD